jgi:hypothetical protein
MAISVNKIGSAFAVVGKCVELIEYAQDLQLIVFDAIDHLKWCSRMLTVTRIFLVLPPDRLDAYTRWLHLLVSQALQDIARTQSGLRTPRSPHRQP